MTEEFTQKVSDLSLQPNDEVSELFSNAETVSTTRIRDVFTAKTDGLSTKLDSDIATTLRLIERADDPKLLTSALTKEQSLAYLPVLKKLTATTPHFALTVIDAFINKFTYTFDEITLTVAYITPLISKHDDIVAMTLVKYFSLYKSQAFAVLEDQLESMSLQEDYTGSFRLMALLFQLDLDKSVKLFQMDSLQLLLSTSPKSLSKGVVMEGLKLLSMACMDDGLRKQISTKYLDLLVFGVKSEDKEIQSLSSLVIVKTWDFSGLSVKEVTLDDLLDIFLSSDLNEHALEGLTYLSIKKSVKIRLRRDDSLLFDMTKLLESPSQSTLYGVLVILVNLTTIEEKDEVSQLKKQANKGLEDDMEESEEEIKEYIRDIVELKTIAKICSVSTMSKQAMNQVITIIFNCTKERSVHAEIIKQGGLIRVMDFLARDPDHEMKILANRALSTLLITSNPQLVFNKSSPRSAVHYLFQFLSDESTAMKDQFQALLSLTNLSILDNDRLTPSQWTTIDDLLVQENKLLRRATLELVSNLMQQKSHLPDLFDPESKLAQKRLDLLVKLMKLDDLKSQCAAVASLSFAVGVPFIALELAKKQELIETLVMLMETQATEDSLMERVAFVLYNFLFCCSEDTSLFNSIVTPRLRDAVDNVLMQNKSDDVLEIVQEIHGMVQ